MILDLEELVPSRETCEKLRDAGFPQATRFVYFAGAAQGPEYWDWTSDDLNNFCAPIAAPTAAELGASLSKAASGTPGRMVDSFSFGDGSYWAACLKDCNGGERNICCKNADTEAEARALLWLDLHERNLLPESTYHHEAPESQ